MSTAPATLRTAIPAFFHSLNSELLDEVFPARPQVHLDDVIAKAKADADGGIVLFRIGDYYAAFDEDAEAIAEALGVQIQPPAPGMLRRDALAGGAGRKQILLTASHLARNLRLLRFEGHQDVWIYSQQDGAQAADDIGQIDDAGRDYRRAEALSRK